MHFHYITLAYAVVVVVVVAAINVRGRDDPSTTSSPCVVSRTAVVFDSIVWVDQVVVVVHCRSV